MVEICERSSDFREEKTTPKICRSLCGIVDICRLVAPNQCDLDVRTPCRQTYLNL